MYFSKYCQSKKVLKKNVKVERSITFPWYLRQRWANATQLRNSPRAQAPGLQNPIIFTVKWKPLWPVCKIPSDLFPAWLLFQISHSASHCSLCSYCSGLFSAPYTCQALPSPNSLVLAVSLIGMHFPGRLSWS